MKKIIFCLFSIAFMISAETLFEVKDSANNKVLDVSTDGLRIMNQGDTLMVISSSEIKAVLNNSKGLSRSFSVSTSTSKGSGNDLMRLTGDSTRFWISDTGSGFGVASNSNLKGVNTNLLEVGTQSTVMREGSAGSEYTDFSPDNIFLGLNAGIATTPGIPLTSSGKLNLFFGNDAGRRNTSGGYNVMIGDKAGQNNTSGGNNLFIGNNSGELNTTGSWNLFLGHGSGAKNTATNNMFLGHNSGASNNSGDANLFIGTDAGAYNTGGMGNVFVGQQTGIYNTNGDNNTFVGRWAGNSNQNFSDDNTFIGFSAGSGQNGGNQNTYVGSLSGKEKTSGYYNTFLGYGSGQKNGSGTSNTMLGYMSGWTNTGSNNVFIGMQAGYNEAGSSKLYIANSDTSTPLIKGTFPNSDLTFQATTINANGNLLVSGNSTISGTYMQIVNNPGTGATPTNYVYQGGSTASTSKEFAFAVNDALWVTSHAYIDGNIQIQGGTIIGMTQAGSYTAGVNSTGGVKTFTITFTSTFGTIPKVNVTPKGENFPDVFAVTTRNITTTSFQVNVYRVDSAGGIWGQNLKLDWFAWE
jgi:hypothetical protein